MTTQVNSRNGGPQTIIVRTWLSGRPRPGGLFWAAVSLLVMFVFTQAYWSDFHNAASLLIASPQKVFHDKEWWRLFSALAIHADFKHFLSNAFMFFIFSLLLAGYFGPLLYPLITLFLGAIVNALTLATYEPDVVLLGASGVVYLMAGEWLILYFFIERRYSLFSRALRCIGVTLAVLSPSTVEQNVSYRAHGIGLVVGLFAGSLYFMASKKRFRAAEVYRTIVDEDEDMGASGMFHGSDEGPWRGPRWDQ